MRYATRYAGYAALIVALAGCGGRQRAKPRLGEVERLPRLETVTPDSRKLAVVRSYTATVEPFEKAELCAQVRGYIAAMPAATDIGKPIKKGEALVDLYIPDVVAERDNKKALVEQNENLLAQAVQAIEV